MTLSSTHRFAQSLALAVTLFTTSVSSTAVALTDSSIITDTPVSSVVVKIEDLPGSTTNDYQRIRLRITGSAELPSRKVAPIDLSEDQVAVSIADVPGALSLTSLFRDGDTVLARERLSSGEFFPIGLVNDEQELELNSDFHIEVEYRQYRYKITDHIIAFILGTVAKNSDSVRVAIVRN